MFSLVKGVYGEMTKRDEFFVAILGLNGAGKTTYLEQIKKLLDSNYKGRDLSKITTTVGLNHVKLQLKDCILNLWDLGGQKELRPLWNGYLEECHGLIFMMDSSDKARFDEVIESLEQIMSVDHVHANPLLILLNKCDSDVHSLPNGELKEKETPIPSNEIQSEPEGGGDETAQGSMSSRWQSFELDNNELEPSSSSSFTSANDSSSKNIRVEFDRRFGSIHSGDLAIFSISAMQNLNVKKSVNWLIFALKSCEKDQTDKS